VFAVARKDEVPYYEVVFASTGGGRRTTSSGLTVDTRDLHRIRPLPSDTVIVAGGDEPGVLNAVADQALTRWLVRAAKVARRTGSVCSGAFILAAAGLLDGKCAATHWRACARLAELFPRVRVDSNAIYVRDGRIWTSAGVTTGIDMALGMVEEDLTRGVADGIAADMVLYVRRPGFQAQFSSALVTQSSRSGELSRALEWLRGHLDRASVVEFAKRAALSERTLHRRCHEELGASPAKLIARLRLEQARMLLATTQLSAKVVADQCGFGNAARMSRSFMRELGLAPREYRLLHAG
jgi:transcriptional regulator GlxA family with amidase domain